MTGRRVLTRADDFFMTNYRIIIAVVPSTKAHDEIDSETETGGVLRSVDHRSPEVDAYYAPRGLTSGSSGSRPL
jgi:hypothetical protein